MDLREETMNTDDKKFNKNMRQFWLLHDKLYDDMDKLSYEKYLIRYNEMWDSYGKAHKGSRQVFLITLGKLPYKAQKLYGTDGSSARFNELFNIPLDERNLNIFQKIKFLLKKLILLARFKN